MKARSPKCSTPNHQPLKSLWVPPGKTNRVALLNHGLISYAHAVVGENSTYTYCSSAEDCAECIAGNARQTLVHAPVVLIGPNEFRSLTFKGTDMKSAILCYFERYNLNKMFDITNNGDTYSISESNHRDIPIDSIGMSRDFRRLYKEEDLQTAFFGRRVPGPTTSFLV